jgi:hypothetical protein
MTDVKDRPDSLEDIASGLLSGTMVTLLGCAAIGLIAWQIVAQLTGWLPDLQAMSAGLPPTDFQAMTASERGVLIGKSLLRDGPLLLLISWVISRGVRFVRKNLALLRGRPSRADTRGSHL